MCPSLLLDAPAKVNLGLRITGVREDGYHELESLFAPLDLADRIALCIESARRGSVSLQLGGDDAHTPHGDDNLAVRAARAFFERTAIAARVEIALTKHTPVAAGLGGGSSDAAAVLRGLAQAFPRALETAELERLAVSLGADVPYFLDPVPAWVTGVGERKEPVRDLPSLALLLANPGEPLATAEVYRAYDALARPRATRDVPRSARPVDLSRRVADPDALAALLHNDLEDAALRLCPAIARMRQQLLESGPRAVGMSGSGATLFAVFPDRAAAEAAAVRLPVSAPGWTRVAATREGR